jgi:hypothetical protein
VVDRWDGKQKNQAMSLVLYLVSYFVKSPISNQSKVWSFAGGEGFRDPGLFSLLSVIMHRSGDWSGNKHKFPLVLRLAACFPRLLATERKKKKRARHEVAERGVK